MNKLNFVEFTLCIIFRQNESSILLGKKSKGIGKGYWNGFGGHVENNETIEEANFREVYEETGIILNSSKKIGINTFIFPEENNIHKVHIFKSKITDLCDLSNNSGEFEEFRWFEIRELPYDKMWYDDVYWFPYMLKKESFEGFYFFDNSDNLQSYYIKSGIIL